MAIFEEKAVTLRDGASVLLRPPREEDAEAMLAYLDALRRETDFILYAPQDALPTLDEERAIARSWRDKPNSIAITAWHGEELISICDCSGSRFHRERHKRGIGISIRQGWCGRGLGTVLMNELVDQARRQGATLLELTVFAHNARAIALYRKCGFVECGRKPRDLQYADGRHADTLVMSRWIGD